MRKLVNGTESLRVLILRAAATVIVVLAVLLGLRMGGLTCVEQDLPVQMVEGAVQITAIN